MNTIGVLCDGQLARMTAQAALRRKISIMVYGTVGPHSPAGQIVGGKNYIQGAWNDAARLREFGDRVDVATIDWENVPPETLEILENQSIPTRPGSQVLRVIQDRMTEKQAAIDAGLRTAKFGKVDSLDDLRSGVEQAGDSILKTRGGGYDGKGQWRLTKESDLEQAWEDARGKPLILEQLVRFKMEASVIVARSPSGQMVAFDPIENQHESGILRASVSPARIDANVREKMIRQAKDLAEHLGVEGLLAVEMFVLEGGGILINEVAPRPHNSGHGTIDGYAASQYDLLIDAITDEKLQTPQRSKDFVMVNLLGNDLHKVDGEDGSSIDDLHVHKYGKEPKKGRKVGHVTRTFSRGTLISSTTDENLRIQRSHDEDFPMEHFLN